MYRHSSQVNCLVKPSLPSPEITSDSESDIIDALDRKRRHLDEEISKFKAIKDKEFRDFEKDLRTKRKRGRGSSTSSETSPSKQPGAASTTSVLNLLASAHNGAANGWAAYRPKRGGDGVGEKITKPAPLSKPTLSLDKLNISGETTPPTSGLGTPPTPSMLTRSVARAPSRPSTTFTPPRSNPEKPAPPTPTSERFDSFVGVFTPAYLPLLDSRDHTPLVRSPQPLAPHGEDEEKTQLQLNAESKRVAARPASQSLPQQSVSPSVVATKRTHSTPLLPSTSLPSALRSGKGDGGGASARKRKHVTFQLADSAIVEPSSSYEELPSPEPRARSESEVRDLPGPDETVKNGSSKSGAAKRNASSPKEPAKENNCLSPKDANQKRGRLRSPAVSPLPSPSPSPTMDAFIPSPDESGFSGGLAASEDGGSGVGFFELDEELASPAFTEDRSFDFKVQGEEERVEDLDEKKVGNILEGGVQVGSFAAGSVPINIVRHPTGSWVGSYGH